MIIEALTKYLDDVEARNEESPDTFDLPTLQPEAHELFITVAGFEIENRWIICDAKLGMHHYVGYGGDPRYVDCYIFGAPERIRRDCILDRELVINFCVFLPNLNLSSPWHWVPFSSMYLDT